MSELQKFFLVRDMSSLGLLHGFPVMDNSSRYRHINCMMSWYVSKNVSISNCHHSSFSGISSNAQSLRKRRFASYYLFDLQPPNANFMYGHLTYGSVELQMIFRMLKTPPSPSGKNQSRSNKPCTCPNGDWNQ